MSLRHQICEMLLKIALESHGICWINDFKMPKNPQGSAKWVKIKNNPEKSSLCDSKNQKILKMPMKSQRILKNQHCGI